MDNVQVRCIFILAVILLILILLINTFMLIFQFGSAKDSLIPVDVSLVDEIWMPDIEILNLKQVSFSLFQFTSPS